MATADTSPATPANQNVLAAISYLGFFVTGIILLLIEKKNEFVRFHAMQSTIFFLGLTILSMGMRIVLPWIYWVLGYFISLFGFIVMIVLAWKAYTGERYKLPYIGEMAETQLGKLGKRV